VRIALALKKIDYEYIPVHLVKDGGFQHTNEYASVNPAKQVPTLIIDNNTLAQSIAILEYLEETRTEFPLLPTNPAHRVKVREIVQTIGSDIQPIQNLRVLNKIAHITGDDKQKVEWAKYWIEAGLKVVEQMLSNSAGKYCVGDAVSLADVFLVPQVYNAVRFGVPTEQFPTITRINNTLSQLEEFKKSHPSVQPDAEA
jgi:maleylacetoacetate isomerase